MDRHEGSAAVALATPESAGAEVRDYAHLKGELSKAQRAVIAKCDRLANLPARERLNLERFAAIADDVAMAAGRAAGFARLVARAERDDST